MQKKNLCYCAIILVGARTALPQESLQTLWNIAWERNPEIKAARYDVEVARSRILQAGSIPDPEAEVVWMRSEDAMAGGETIEWMVRQPYPGFGKRARRLAAAKSEVRLEEYRYLDTVRAVRMRLAVAWWDLWAARRERRLMREMVETATILETTARIAFEAGRANFSEVLQASLRKGLLQNEEQAREAEERIALAAVNALLDAPPDAPREADDASQPTNAVRSWEALWEGARAHNARLLSQAAAIELGRADYERARRERMPDVAGFARVQQAVGAGSIREYAVGFSLMLPWVWPGKYRAEESRAQAAWGTAQSRYVEVSRSLETELLQWHRRAEVLLRRLRLHEEQLLEQARQGVRSVLAEYAEGVANFAEVVEALNVRIEIERDYTRSVADFGRASAQLDYLAGTFTPPEDKADGQEGAKP